MYLKMNVYFPCFPGISHVDWNSVKKCPKKIHMKTIINGLSFMIVTLFDMNKSVLFLLVYLFIVG